MWRKPCCSLLLFVWIERLISKDASWAVSLEKVNPWTGFYRACKDPLSELWTSGHPELTHLESNCFFLTQAASRLHLLLGQASSETFKEQTWAIFSAWSHQKLWSRKAASCGRTIPFATKCILEERSQYCADESSLHHPQRTLARVQN